MHRLGRRPLADQPVCPVHGAMVLVAERRTGELDRWDRSTLLRLRLRVFDRPARPYTETLCIFSKQKVPYLSFILSKIEAYEASQLLSAKASLKSNQSPNAGKAHAGICVQKKRRRCRRRRVSVHEAASHHSFWTGFSMASSSGLRGRNCVSGRRRPSGPIWSISQ